MATTQPIRDKKEIQALVNYYLDKGELRNYLLIVMGLYTALRISDLLRLTWDDVYDFRANCLRLSFSIKEKKTGKVKIVALNKEVLKALAKFKNSTAVMPGQPLFQSRKTKGAIGRTQAYRIIKQASNSLALSVPVSCHSLRKTFGYHAVKAGASPAVVMEIYNHSSYAVSRRYLGLNQDEQNQVYWSLALLG